MSVLDKLTSGEVFIVVVILILAAAAVLSSFAQALGQRRTGHATDQDRREAE